MYVVKLLDSIDYKKNLYGKKIMENSCGDGSILKEIVRRYIKDCLKQDKTIEQIKFGLQNDIYGAEIDKTHFETCVYNLNTIAKEFNIHNVNWNIINKDFLIINYTEIFDFVVGNPPYISYGELDIKTRNFLKDNFVSCKHGKYDYCYAFIEASIKSLKNGGKLSYLIPNSIFKNVFAQSLRQIMIPHLHEIIDYTIKKVFKNVLTSSAILICNKNINSTSIKYHDIVKNKNLIIPKSKLKDKWVFCENIVNNTNKKRFGDYFHASVSIATLYNKAYVISDYSEDINYILTNNYKIEKSLLKKCVSPRSLTYNKKEYIIFPYKYNDKGKLLRYTNETFIKTFPEATKYLRSKYLKLQARKSEKNTTWFEYGRSQALAHLYQPKLLLSTVITKEVKIYEIEKDCIPYSGIYIIPREDMSLNIAKNILKSNDFLNYVRKIGINASGNSLRITAVDVNNYMF